MSFDGEIIWRGEPGYEEARVGRVFNARRPDRFPAAVLLAASEDDVVAGVRLAATGGSRFRCAPAGTAGRRGACATASC